jgi:FkbM family methyltransferase
MRFCKNSIVFILIWICRLLGTRITIKLLEELVLIRKFEGIFFLCLSQLTTWRSKTFKTQEPETIEWINGFSKGDSLWDVGANVGCYGFYAAQRGHEVISIEPGSGNYYVLNRNIEINKLKNVKAYCVAFNDTTEINNLYMKANVPGTAANSFGSGKETVFKQGMIGLRIDDFVQIFSPVFPNHIKIDVDGNEHKIIKGAVNTLGDKRLKSILIEIDDKDSDNMTISFALNMAGFIVKKKVRRAEGIFNYIFARGN